MGLRLLPERDTVQSLTDYARERNRKRVGFFYLLDDSALTRADFERNIRAAGGALSYFARAERLFIGRDPLRWTHAAIAEFRSFDALLAAAAADDSSCPAARVAIYPFRDVRPPEAVQSLLSPLRLVGKCVDTGEAGLEHWDGASEEPGGIVPSREQVLRCSRDAREQPAYFLNLLSFKERADYEGADVPARSGAEAYRRYGVVALAAVRAMGGRIAHAGLGGDPLYLGGVSDGDDASDPALGKWDEIAIAQYPTPRTVLKLGRFPGYTASHKHRTAALERTTLIVTSAD